MEIPFIGPLTLSGFSSGWFFLYLIAVVGAEAVRAGARPSGLDIGADSGLPVSTVVV